MTPTRFLSHTEKVDLMLDVLRVNGLHQSTCDNRTSWGTRPCNCWLSEPSEPPALDEQQVRVDVAAHAIPWRPDLPEESWPAVRVTYLPTGHTVTRQGRSQLQAKAEALHALAELVATAVPVPAQEETP